MKRKDLLNNSLTLPFILFFLNFFLKLFYITDQDICIDEPFTIYHSQFDVIDIITFLKPTNNPPLYEIILHGWIKLFGIEPFSVRFLPLIFSSLTVVFIYHLGELLNGRKTAIIASLLFTFSSYQIFYSHDSRSYTLFLLLTVISCFLFAKILKHPGRNVNKVFFALINIFLIYTHYFGFLVWLIQGLYLLFTKRNQFKLFWLLYTVSLISFIPQLLIFFQRTVSSVKTGTWIEKGVNIESLFNKFVVFSNMPVVAVFCMIILLLLGVFMLIFKKGKSGEGEVNSILFFSLWFFVPLLGMFFVSYKLPVFLDRYLIFCTPAYYFLIANSPQILFVKKQHEYIFSVVLIMAFLLSVNFNPSKKREVSALVNYVKNKKDNHTMVIICAHEFINNFTYYYDKKIFSDIMAGNEYQKMTQELNKKNVYPIMKISDLPTGELIKFNKIIFLDASADFSNPGNGIYPSLKNRYNEVKKTHFNNIFDVYEMEKNQLN